MIVRIKFEGDKIMLFGDSYKPWKMQMDEFMRRCAEGLGRPVSADISSSKWIGWGGLKWCQHEEFQEQLNREGCQYNEPDNPNPRRYEDMDFRPMKNKLFAEVLDEWEAGQRMLKINKLTDEEYWQYQRGELKITV
jgi:hypothetical protein